MAVASLRIHNSGHSDANRIRIATSWGWQLKEVSCGSAVFQFSADISPDRRKAVIFGDRLSPSEEAVLFFVLDRNNETKDGLELVFVDAITYEGGIGKTGESWWTSLAIIVATFLATLLLALI